MTPLEDRQKQSGVELLKSDYELPARLHDQAKAAPQAERPAPAEESDAELVAAIAAGGRLALAELYDRYSPMLMALAQRFVGSRHDAEDLIHDLFIEVWLRADSYDASRGSVRTWLLLRTRSRALDRVKSAAWRLAFRSDSEASLGALVAEDSPDVDLASANAEKQMRSAVLILTDEERGLLDLVYVKGCSLSEVAGQLQAPLGTIKSRLSRVLGKLRRSLNHLGSEV